MNLDNVKLIFADLDDTLTELYKPATENVQLYLNKLLEEGKIIVIITGQGKENIYDRVINKIKNNLRKNILICGCGGSYIYGFDDNGNINDSPYYSVYEEKLSDEQKILFRKVTKQLVDEFNLITYNKMSRDDFKRISKGNSTTIMLDDRVSQITFEVVNDLRLREEIIKRGKDLIENYKLPIQVVKAGTFAIDFSVYGVSKTYAVKYIMNNLLKKFGIENIKNNEIQVWGDKYSLVNGGTDMNMLYGLNKQVLAIDFRNEPEEELDVTYNIKKWNGKKQLCEGLEEYLKSCLGNNN